jgi:hypothetical protein
MRVKSAYREKPEANIPADFPAVKINTPPTATAAVTSDNPELAAAIAAAEKADETAQPANLALLHQIEKLQAAEALQRQWHEQRELERQQREANIAAMKPPTIEQRMEWLKSIGVSPDDRKMILSEPQMLDHLDVVDYCAHQAIQAGHQRDTPAYRDAVRANFTKAMNHIQAQAQTAPEMFRPPPPPEREPRPEARAALVSAPISRQTASSNGERYEPTPSRITLSADERAIADASGISHTEYARNKLKLQRLKREGQIP